MFALVLNFRNRVFLKSAVIISALCLVDWENLRFNVLLGDVHFSRFSSQVFFCFLDSQGKIVPNPEETQIWEGENESVSSRQQLILQLLLVIAAFI